MLKKTILAATAAAAALLSTGALAHDDHGRGHGWGHYKHHYRHYAPRPVVVVPAPRVVYAPPPQAPYAYYAAPVVVRPAPVYSAPSLSLRFDIPL
jgi:hypothetical protein